MLLKTYHFRWENKKNLRQFCHHKVPSKVQRKQSIIAILLNLKFNQEGAINSTGRLSSSANSCLLLCFPGRFFKFSSSRTLPLTLLLLDSLSLKLVLFCRYFFDVLWPLQICFILLMNGKTMKKELELTPIFTFGVASFLWFGRSETANQLHALISHRVRGLNWVDLGTFLITYNLTNCSFITDSKNSSGFR